MDASPTKAWLVHQFGLEDYSWHYNYTFGKRPAEELYDLHKDPDELLNCASDPAYAAQKTELSARLVENPDRCQRPASFPILCHSNIITVRRSCPRRKRAEEKNRKTSETLPLVNLSQLGGPNAKSHGHRQHLHERQKILRRYVAWYRSTLE